MKSTAESTHISDDTLSGVSGASGFVPYCLVPPSLLISLWGSLSTLSTLCSSRWYLWTYMFSLDWLFVWFLFGFYSEPFLNSCNLSVINYLCNQFLQWATTKPHLLFSGPLRDDHLLASPVLWIPFLSQLYWVLMSCRYTSLDTRLPCSTLRAMLLCLAGPVLVNLHSQQTFPNLSPPCFAPPDLFLVSSASLSLPLFSVMWAVLLFPGNSSLSSLRLTLVSPLLPQQWWRDTN